MLTSRCCSVPQPGKKCCAARPSWLTQSASPSAEIEVGADPEAVGAPIVCNDGVPSRRSSTQGPGGELGPRCCDRRRRRRRCRRRRHEFVHHHRPRDFRRRSPQRCRGASAVDIKRGLDRAFRVAVEGCAGFPGKSALARKRPRSPPFRPTTTRRLESWWPRPWSGWRRGRHNRRGVEDHRDPARRRGRPAVRPRYMSPYFVTNAEKMERPSKILRPAD